METDCGGRGVFRICITVLGGVRAERINPQPLRGPIYAAVWIRLLIPILMVSVCACGFRHLVGASDGVALAWQAGAIKSGEICHRIAVRRSVIFAPSTGCDDCSKRAQDFGKPPLAC